MGVEIDYSVQNRLTNKMAFADHGGTMQEYFKDSGVRLLAVSNLEGNKGTVFVMGDTNKVGLTEHQSIFDIKGSPAKFELIDKTKADVGIYTEIRGTQELSVEITGEEEQNSMRIFLCDFSQILAEKVLQEKSKNS
jgi:hypothetical protein